MQYEWIVQQISMPQLSSQLTNYVYVYKNDYKNLRNLHISHWSPSFQPCHVLGTFQPGQGQAEQPHSSCSALNVWTRGLISASRCLSWGGILSLPTSKQALDTWPPGNIFEFPQNLFFVQLKLPYKKHSMPAKSSKPEIHPFTQGPEETTSVGWDRPPSAHPLLGATAPGAGNEDLC